MNPGAAHPQMARGRLRALVLSYCHPSHLSAAEAFATILGSSGGEVAFLPASRHSRAEVIGALTRSTFDLVAYFGHGDRDGWLGYWSGFRPHELLNIRRQKLFLSTACHGMSREDGHVPFGARLIEMKLADVFLGSNIATDSEAGRIYMAEFARALAAGPDSVVHLHQRAKSAARALLPPGSWNSLESLEIAGDGALRIPTHSGSETQARRTDLRFPDRLQ